MALGLFTLSLESTVNKSLSRAKVSADVTRQVIDDVKDGIVTFNLLAYTLMSLFAVYFALFKARSRRGRIGLLVLKFLTLSVYVPVLYWSQAYIDASLLTVILLARFLHTAWYAWLYRTWDFIAFNVTTLCYVHGKCWFLENKSLKPFVCFYGGDQFLYVGDKLVSYVSTNDLYVAIRGRIEKDLSLSRKVELFNGECIYVFCEHPAVGVVNTDFRLEVYEDVPEISG
uniref:Orf4 n=1 Tax=229E-related bat coronavirus TaxID=1739614 RepID=A0A0P0K0Z4_CVH22|nr:orf4 [229E-related bat coronavirus]